MRKKTLYHAIIAMVNFRSSPDKPCSISHHYPQSVSVSRDYVTSALNPSAKKREWNGKMFKTRHWCVVLVKKNPCAKTQIIRSSPQSIIRRESKITTVKFTVQNLFSNSVIMNHWIEGNFRQSFGMPWKLTWLAVLLGRTSLESGLQNVLRDRKETSETFNY